MSPLTGVPILFLSFPGVTPLSRLHRRAIVCRPSPGLKIPLANASHLLDKLRFINQIV